MKKMTTLLRSAATAAFLLLLQFYSFSQSNSRVTGKVNDEDGKPLAGVTVRIVGGGPSTTTGDDGSFDINVPPRATLAFSYVGYEEQQLKPGNQTQLTVVMKRLGINLSDLVVIGYGTQKKASTSFAVSKLKNDNFDERPLTRVDQALVGQLAGVTVKQNTGVPGKAFSIQVRGSGSISGGNEPLYVIDGFPLTLNSSNTANGSFSTGNPLDNINPNDIESIEVLKDAAAAAIYGSRASNGVVIITTKHGQAGKVKISVNAYTGFNQAQRKLQMMNGQQWIDQATEVINAQYVAKYPGATANDDRATRLVKTGGVVDPNYILDPRWAMPGHPGLSFIDWQDVIERKGQMQNYEVSASGGNDAVKYFISGNYGNQEGFVINLGYKVYSLRANIDINASKRLKFGINIAPSFSITQDPGVDGKDNIFHQALSMSPVQEDTMGFFPNTGKNGQYIYSNSTNSPLGKLTYNKGTTKRYRTLGTIYGEYQIINGLSFKTSVNLDNTDNIATTYVPYITVGSLAARTFTGSNNLLAATSGTYNSYRRQTFVNENTLFYNTTIRKDHNLSLLAGYAYNWDRLDRATLSSNGGYTSAVIQTLNAAAAVTGNTTSSQSVLISYFSRLQYAYRGKYLLTASMRRDGTSRAGINNHFETFPAVSVAWRASDEDFFRRLSVISDFKLRLSYGINGNVPTADYGSIATLGSYGYPLGATPVATIGQAPNVLANPDLKWERSKTWDIGFDFGILKNRITGSFDVYNKLNNDLLLNVQVPAVTGFQTFLSNLDKGSVRNIGQELEITTRNMVGKFQWNSTLTFTHNTNKIVALAPGQTQIIIPNGFTVSDEILRVGAPLNSIYVLKVIGFLTAKDIIDNVARYGNEQEGDFKFEDINKDGVITEADKQIVGHPNPDYTYGVTNTFRYKGFDLTVFVQGQWGGSIYSQLGRALTRPGQGRADNHPASYVNRWMSPTNQGDGRFGKAYSTYNNPITSATDWLYSSDYIRVRNITLGYNFNSLIKLRIFQNARAYVSLENFFGHDKYVNGLNPEAANTTVSTNSAYPEAGDYGGLPLPKSFIVGINITF